VLGAHEETGAGSETLYNIAGVLFNILRFPVVTFEERISFGAGMLISAILDSLLIEFVLLVFSRYLFKKIIGSNATT